MAAPEEREPKAESGADNRSQDAVARCGDGGAEVRLQHDDGADGSPVAVLEAKSQRDHQQRAAARAVLAAWIRSRCRSQFKQALRRNSIDAAI